MSQTDVIPTWIGTFQFAVTTSPRRFRFVTKKDGGDTNRWLPFDYVEVDNRSNSQIVYWSVNGSTATATLATGGWYGQQPNFRLAPYSIDRIFIQATSISAVVPTAATTVFITAGRF